MSIKPASVGEQWREALRDGGYEPPRLSTFHLLKLRLQTRTWRRLRRIVGLRSGATLFEFGCGGGTHVVPLAMRGYQVSGIDVSPEVLGRCRRYIALVEGALKRTLPIRLFEGDFLRFEHQEQYAVVFNFGVIEHFLDDRQRLGALRKMFELTKPGGFVVSVVPSGMHPLRNRMRAEGLGGYRVPEIDYADTMAAEEMRAAGAMKVTVYPLSLFHHFLLPRLTGPRRWLRVLAYLMVQALIPIPPRRRWAFAHCGSLLIVGVKCRGTQSMYDTFLSPRG